MNRACRLVSLVAGASLLAGCADIWLKDSYDVLVHRSAPQTLVVTNSGPSPLTIGAGNAMQTIAPAGHIEVRFQVDSIGTLKKPDGTPYWTVLPDQYRDQFTELDGLGLVDASGDPLTLNFHDGVRPVVVAFSLNLCPGAGWQGSVTAQATYSLVVPDPQPAIPHALCPQ